MKKEAKRKSNRVRSRKILFLILFIAVIVTVWYYNPNRCPIGVIPNKFSVLENGTFQFSAPETWGCPLYEEPFQIDGNWSDGSPIYSLTGRINLLNGGCIWEEDPSFPYTTPRVFNCSGVIILCRANEGTAIVNLTKKFDCVKGSNKGENINYLYCKDLVYEQGPLIDKEGFIKSIKTNYTIDLILKPINEELYTKAIINSPKTYRNYSVISASCRKQSFNDFSWFSVKRIKEVLTQDAPNETWCSPYWSEGNPCKNTIDQDWETKGNPMSGDTDIVWENFTKPKQVYSAQFYAKFFVGQNVGITFYVWNYKHNKWDILGEYREGSEWDNSCACRKEIEGRETGLLNKTFDIPPTSLIGKEVQIQTALNGSMVGWSAYYEGEMIWYKDNKKQRIYSYSALFLTLIGLIILVVLIIRFK